MDYVVHSQLCCACHCEVKIASSRSKHAQQSKFVRWREHSKGKVFYNLKECSQGRECVFCLCLLAVGRQKWSYQHTNDTSNNQPLDYVKIYYPMIIFGNIMYDAQLVMHNWNLLVLHMLKRKFHSIAAVALYCPFHLLLLCHDSFLWSCPCNLCPSFPSQHHHHAHIKLPSFIHHLPVDWSFC